MKYLLSLSLLFLLWSCETQRLNRLCEEGEAVPVAFTRYSFADELEGNCVRAINQFSTRSEPRARFRDYWIIENQASYNSMNVMVQAEWRSIKERDVLQTFDCDTLILPEIDFSQRALFFARIHATGCKPLEQEIEMVRCDETQTYQIRLAWPYEGQCTPLYSDRVWLLIPPLEPGYTLEIQDETY